MQFTKVFHELLLCKTRYCVVQGGTSASKSWSILQLLVLRAIKHQGLRISIVSETLPHLKRGVISDLIQMLKQENQYDESRHDMSNNIFHFGKSQIEFFSAEDSKKLRGPRRNILWINECNNVSWDAFTELEVRTSDQVFLDFNPTSSFYVHERIMTKPKEEVAFYKFSYKDNDKLSPNIIRSIESKQSDKEWFKVYGLGEIGSHEGAVFQNWELIDDMPVDFKWELHGMDFGFTHDPSTLIRVICSNDCLYLDEVLYETALTNQDIANRIIDVKNKTIIADSAEPKSIEELRRLGYDVKPAAKGPDSIRKGIDAARSYKMYVTKRSTNLIKELRNYSWKRDSNGKWTNNPVDNWNHLLDPLRYVLLSKSKNASSASAADFASFDY